MGSLDDLARGMRGTAPDPSASRAQGAASHGAGFGPSREQMEADQAQAEAQRNAASGAAALAPESTSPAPASAPQRIETYTVVDGDTLSAIGEKYGVDYMKIAEANGIDDPDLIFPGQELRIPAN